MRWTLLGLLLFLSSCSMLNYDPACSGSVPACPGSKWSVSTLDYPCKKIANTYTAEDVCKVLSLPELLDIALSNNPATKTSWFAARAAAFGYHAALSPFYPTVEYISIFTSDKNTIGAGVSAAGTALASNGQLFPNASQSGISSTSTGSMSPSTSFNTFFNEITINYLLFDFGGRTATANAAFQVMLAANWQHQYTLQQVILSVLSAYISWVDYKNLTVAYKQNLEDAEVALKAANVMRNAGLATMTDVLQAKAAVEQARYNLELAIGGEKNGLMQLIIALGLPPETNICVQDLPNELPVVQVNGDIQTLMDLATKRRPDLGVAIANVRQQEQNEIIAFSAGMPTLTSTAILSRQHFLNNPQLDGYNNSINLQLTVPIFEGFYYYNTLKEAREQVRQALAQLDVQITQVYSAVATNYYAFTTAAAAIPSAQSVLDYSDRSFRGYVAQYKVGTSSFLDVLNALTTLSNARAQLVAAKAQWATALANLAFAVGILEDDNAYLNFRRKGPTCTE